MHQPLIIPDFAVKKVVVGEYDRWFNNIKMPEILINKRFSIVQPLNEDYI